MMLVIRPQVDADRAAVQSLIGAAFCRPDRDDVPPVEVGLNQELLRDPSLAAELTLVAEVDGSVVGQVTSSYGALASSSGEPKTSPLPVVGVGPVSVSPDRQGTGIGTALMRALVTAAEAAGEPALVLLGEPEFYRRFGFIAASEVGMIAPDPAWGKYFQVRPLRVPTEGLAGFFRYAAPFDRL